jgi:hypothetical protein
MATQTTNFGVTRAPKNNPEAIAAWLTENRDLIIRELSEKIETTKKNGNRPRTDLRGAMLVYKSCFEMYRKHEKALQKAWSAIYSYSGSQLTYDQKVAYGVI